MLEYIDKNDVLKLLHDIGGCGAKPDTWENGWDKAIDEAYRQVQELPASDVAPVVHGWWITVSSHSLFNEEGTMCDVVIEEKCSQCSTYASRYVTELPFTYCHECGAKMDGDTNGPA